MLLTFKNQKLTIGQLKSGKLRENLLTENEMYVTGLINDWVSGKKQFELKTSGSTGQPKIISLSREILEYSAKTSLEYLDPNHQFTSSLLCINPQYIGGMMVVIRALVGNFDLSVSEVSSDPFDGLDGVNVDLTSMVPLQVESYLKQAPKVTFKHVIIGGAPVDPILAQKLIDHPTQFYQSFGMTETASHIALRNLSAGSEMYEVIGDAEIDTDERGCLKINGSVTNNEWLITNDMVQIQSSGSFKWLGRYDHVINTGGLKVFPEQLEKKLSEAIEKPFFIAGVPDQTLGTKVAIWIESEEHIPLSFDFISKYEKPKEVFYLKKFVRTPTGKIDRKSTMNSI